MQARRGLAGGSGGGDNDTASPRRDGAPNFQTTVNVGFEAAEAADAGYALLSEAAMAAVSGVWQGAALAGHVPLLAIRSSPPSTAHCATLTLLGTGERGLSDVQLRALDAHAGAVTRMLTHGPSSSRLAAVALLRRHAVAGLRGGAYEGAGRCATLSSPPDALVDALGGVVRAHGAPVEPPLNPGQHLTDEDNDIWSVATSGMRLLPDSVPGDEALIAAGALSSFHAMHVLIVMLPPPARGMAPDARHAPLLHRHAARLLDSGLGDDVLSWACSDMYPHSSSAAAAVAAFELPEARAPRRFRGPPLPKRIAMLSDAPLAARGRVAALQLASRLVVHGVMHDAASADRFGAFASAAMRMAVECMAAPPSSGQPGQPADAIAALAGVRVRAAAAQLVYTLLCAKPGGAGATRIDIAPLQSRLAVEALAASALPRALALAECDRCSVGVRSVAMTACACLANTAPSAAVVAPLTAALAAQLAAAAAAAAAARQRAWPDEDEAALLHATLSSLNALSEFAEVRAAPAFGAAARDQVRALAAALVATPRGRQLQPYCTHILARLAAAPAKQLAQNAMLNTMLNTMLAPAAAPADAASGAGGSGRACGAGCGATTRLKLCSSCEAASYCCAACQRAHWKAHKVACRAAAAAAAAAAAESEGEQ
jgi:hypothetical protein